MKDSWNRREVEHLVKKAVGLWRDPHNAKLYRSNKYIGGWILENLGEEEKAMTQAEIDDPSKPWNFRKTEIK